jgi:hypothetical protein
MAGRRLAARHLHPHLSASCVLARGGQHAAVVTVLLSPAAVAGVPGSGFGLCYGVPSQLEPNRTGPGQALARTV